MVQPSGSEADTVAEAVAVGVTGQTVVPMAMTDVTVRAGHLVTDGAHDVMVDVTVVYMVEVVKLVGSADSVADSVPVTEAVTVAVGPVGSAESVAVPVGSEESVAVAVAVAVASVPVGSAVDDSV